MRFRFGFILCFWASNCLAAPGKIAQAPVIEATGVQPNILLILDDSGSMGWEDTLNKGVGNLGLQATLSYLQDTKIFSNGDEWKVNESVNDSVQIYINLATCRGFNVLAYDPSISYRPWPGYADKTIDEIEHLYYLRWDDNGDDEYGFEECGYSIDKEGEFVLDDKGRRHETRVDELSVTKKTNYANWFYYYRDRMKVAKSAFSGVVTESSARVGLRTIHQRNERDIDDVFKGSHRQGLIDDILSATTNGGTPLRRTLKKAGEYFRGDSSPILSGDEGGMCQQNYAVLMTDGYWNGLSPDVGNADGVGKAWVRPSDQDAYSNTLADVAMKYYQTDLFGSLANMVPIVPGVDENRAQHLVTYTVGFGVNGTVEGGPVDPDAAFDWPEPKKDALTTIDDLRHAAWNSRGKFLNAPDPQELIDALNNIARDIAARSASTGSLEIGRPSAGAGTNLVQTTYDPATWQGDVVARQFGDDGQLESASWSLTEKLADLKNLHKKRSIWTINPSADIKGRAFAFDAKNIERLSLIQLLDLAAFYGDDLSRFAGRQGEIDISGKTISVADNELPFKKNKIGELIDYLKGNNSGEGEKFRARNGKYLGDIVHSSPAIVGAPSSNYSDDIADDKYSAFRTTYKDRDSIVYVGANDGMLHAIDMASGEEVFAFMPHGVFSTEPGIGIRQLARKDYVHRYYVDASPMVRDAYLQLAGEDNASWHTLLLGGLGGGGKSVYMLDITDPKQFDKPEKVVEWEFSHQDLGYSFSEVQVARLNDGNWYAIFGNGYNADSDGKAKLFIVDLADPSRYALLDTGVGHNDGGSCIAAGSDCNGLSSPELADIDADGVFDWGYAGDLHGNVWAFDLRNFKLNKIGTGAVSRLFQSCAVPLDDASSGCAMEQRQPITTKVAVARNSTLNSTVEAPNLNIYWGTGQLLTLQDKDDKRQAFYSVLHTGDGERRYHDDLEQQAFVDVKGVTDARTVAGTHVDYASQYGWYLPFGEAGERLIETPAVRGDLIVFNSTLPGTGGICTAGAGGWLNAVSLRDGIAPERLRSGATQQVFDYDRDGKVDDADDVNGSLVLSIQVSGEPTAPKFHENALYTGIGGSESVEGGVDGMKINAGQVPQSGRSAWYQLR